MDKVQAAILDWNYFQVVKGGASAMPMMKPVPKTFSSAAAYAETFRGLLLEELRASAQQVLLVLDCDKLFTCPSRHAPKPNNHAIIGLDKMFGCPLGVAISLTLRQQHITPSTSMSECL